MMFCISERHQQVNISLTEICAELSALQNCKKWWFQISFTTISKQTEFFRKEYLYKKFVACCKHELVLDFPPQIPKI